MSWLHVFTFPNQGAAFAGGAALVLLIVMLLMGATAPKHVNPTIPLFQVNPTSNGQGPRVLVWETQGALVTLLHRTGEDHAQEVPAKGSRVVSGGRWTLYAVAADGSRVTRALVVPNQVNGSKPGVKISGLSAALAFALLGLGNQACSGNVQQLREPRILSFKAEPSEVPQGQGAMLTWATDHAARVTLEPGGDVTGKTQQRVTPLGSQTYVLTAYSSDGLVDRRALEVRVYAQAAGVTP